MRDGLAMGESHDLIELLHSFRFVLLYFSILSSLQRWLLVIEHGLDWIDAMMEIGIL